MILSKLILIKATDYRLERRKETEKDCLNDRYTVKSGKK